MLEGKKVVVIGAGSGIGRAIAIAAARAGARVVLSGRTAEALDQTARELGDNDAEIVPVDVTDESKVAEYFPTVGAFDALVSTASAGAAGPLATLDAERIERACRTKLWGALFLAKHGAPFAKTNGSFTFFLGSAARGPTVLERSRARAAGGDVRRLREAHSTPTRRHSRRGRLGGALRHDTPLPHGHRPPPRRRRSPLLTLES